MGLEMGLGLGRRLFWGSGLWNSHGNRFLGNESGGGALEWILRLLSQLCSLGGAQALGRGSDKG